MPQQLAGKLCVVTGGASGIGEAVARLLAARGGRVAIADIDLPRAEAAAGAIGGSAYRLDVGVSAEIEQVAARIEAEIGAVDILVTSAGVIQRPVSPNELSEADWDRIFRVDLRGTWACCTAFGRAMVRRRRGSIVTIASIAGMRSMPLHAYSPAKAAVISLTQNLAAEWGPAGVRVNAVSPGFTRTPALQAAIDKGERDVSALEENAALGRLVEPDEIARAVAFLASDEASAITGINLPVDVGWLVAPSWQTYGGLRPSQA